MNRFPNWLRWLLFLPLSIIASVLAYALIKFLSSLFDNFFLFQLLIIFSGAGLPGYIFVRLAEQMVPKYKIFFSIFMTLSYGILAWMTLIKKAILNNIIQLNSLETICLSGIGTIAAVVACFHTYKNQKKKDSDQNDSSMTGQNRPLIKELKSDHKDSISSPDDLESKLMQIISEFDSDATEPKRKEQVIGHSGKPGKLFDVYQDDSHTKKFQEDIFVSDSISNDLEEEISQMMTGLDSKTSETKGKPLLKENRLGRSTESDKFFDVPQRDLSELKLKKRKHTVNSVSQNLDSRISHIIPDHDATKKALKRKPVPDDERLSDSKAMDKSSDPLLGDSQKQRKQVQATDSMDSQAELLPTSAESVAEIKASKAEVLPKENQLSRVNEPKESRVASPRDLPEQVLKEEKDASETDSEDLRQESLPTPVESVPEMKETSTDVLPKEDRLSRIAEREASRDVLPDDLFEQELTEEKHVPEIDSEDFEQESLPSPAAPVPGGQDSMPEILSEEYQLSRFTEPGESSDASPLDLSKQDLTEKKLVTNSESKILKEKSSQKAPELTSVTKNTNEDISKEKDSLISLAELDRLIEYYQDKLPESELTADKIMPGTKEQELDKHAGSVPSDLDRGIETTKKVQVKKDDFESSTAKSDKLLDADEDVLYWQELLQEDQLSYSDLNDFDRQVFYTTTELNLLIKESKTYQFTKYVEHYYKSIKEDENVALIHTEIFYLWCMMETVFDFALESEFRRELIKFFNTKVIDLYLKWKQFTNSDTTQKTAIDFNNFSYYSSQMRTNNIHLNRSFQNTEAEILFGKIVLTKIHESMGNRKIDVDQHTILMPVEIYYHLKQRVIEILNSSTNSICC